MAAQRTHDPGSPPRETTEPRERKTIPASKVGVTLRISEKALKEIDRIQEKTIRAAQEDRKFSWR